MTKKEIYAAYGIEYANGKIVSPLGEVAPLLVNGNAKLGKGVWTWSMLPGCDGEGTCCCTCKGCYAMTGFYRMKGTVAALTIRTRLARYHLDFFKRAVSAQIVADDIKLIRIHAAGDFFGDDYINAWRDIARAAGDCKFWTYTKNERAVHAFDDLDNINVVRSVIDGCGFNFGHCDYILDTYNKLSAAGETPYICRCGIDKNQHCVNCKGCSANKYVLFVEHSTAYKAEEDPAFPALRDLIDRQPRI